METLKTALQEMIDALPDTAAEGFTVSAENIETYKDQLQSVNEAIGEFIQAGGSPSDLDTARFDNLTAAVSAYSPDGGIATMSAHTTSTAATMRQWIVASINEAEIPDVTAYDEMTDDELSNLMETYYEELDDAGFWDSRIPGMEKDGIPINVTSPAGLSLYFHSAGDISITLNFKSAEVTTKLLATELNGKDFGFGKVVQVVPDEWDMNLYFDVTGVDIYPYESGQYIDSTLKKQQKTSEKIMLIDAIPENVYLPVAVRVSQRSGVDEFGVMRSGSSKIQGYKQPTGAVITRKEHLITLNVTDAESFLTSLSGDRTQGSISSFYTAAVVSKIGSGGFQNSSQQVQWYFDTPFAVKYSLSLEPITVGAAGGLPTITGGTDTVPTAYSMTIDDFGRTVNSVNNINRGTNSDTDTIGSNTSGADVRGGTYTQGGGINDPDRISTHPIAAGGTRTTRFSDYGYTSFTISPNPADGYAVDKYIVEVFDPITNILQSTVEYPNDADDFSDSKATAAVNAYLADGVKGKTKIYAAYKKIVPIKLNLTATKVFSGGTVQTAGVGSFTFNLTGDADADGAAINEDVVVTPNAEQGTDGSGLATFGTLKFSKVGTYTYTLTEKVPAAGDADYDEDIRYSTAVHTIVITVSKATNGGLAAEVALDGTAISSGKHADGGLVNSPFTSANTNDLSVNPTVDNPVYISTDLNNSGTFVNSMKKPEGNLTASKEIDLGTMTEDEFTFTLVPSAAVAATEGCGYFDAAGTEHDVPDAGWTIIANTADGSLKFNEAFASLTFPAVNGTYTYTLTENDLDSDSHYTKDSSVWTVTFTVTKNANTGKYNVVTTYEKTGTVASETPAVFKNTYQKSSLTMTKIVVGTGSSASDLFTFTINFTAGADLSAADLKKFNSTGSTAAITKVNGVTASALPTDDTAIASITYTMNATQTFKLNDIPVGTQYSISEDSAAGYFANSSVSGTIVKDSTAVSNNPSLTNTRRTGTLYIEKTMSATGHYDTTDNFVFDVAIPAVTNWTYQVSKATDILPSGELNWGAAQTPAVSGTTKQITLKAGEIARIANIPTGEQYTFGVAENAGNGDNDRYTHTITGDATGTITDGNAETGVKVSFNNTKTTPDPAEWAPTANKTVDGTVPGTVHTGANTDTAFNGLFHFKLTCTQVPAGAPTPADQSDKTNDANGSVTFDNMTLVEGTYKFVISETSTSTDYVTVDGNPVTITVPVVYDHTADKLKVDTANIAYAKNGQPAAKASFDNKEAEPTETTGTLIIKKQLDGTAPDAGLFSFTLKRTSAPEGAEVFTDRTASNTAAGSVYFGTITYKKAGTYIYTVEENDTTGCFLDSRTVTITQAVEDDGTNKLAVTSTAYVWNDGSTENGRATFYNYSKRQIELKAEKTLIGAALTDGAFTFTADCISKPAGAASIPAQTKTNAGQNITFNNIDVTMLGDYVFEVKETAGSTSGMTCSKVVYTVTVTVEQASADTEPTITYAYAATGTQGDGTAPDVPTGTDAETLPFINTYTVPPTSHTPAPSSPTATNPPVYIVPNTGVK